MRLARPLSWRDWGRLGLCALAGWSTTFLVSFLLLQGLLKGVMLDELSHRIQREVLLIERLRQKGANSSSHALAGVSVREGLAPPPGSQLALTGFGRRLSADLEDHHQLRRPLTEVTHPLGPVLGGFWVRLTLPPTAPGGTPESALWLFAPSQPFSSSLFWRLLCTSTALIGTLLGLLLFLEWGVIRPIQRLMAGLPEQPDGSLALLPERGIFALQLFSRRINHLLEAINRSTAGRQTMLRSLVHDLRSPLTRLLLRLEAGDQPIDVAGLRRDADDLRRLGDQLEALARQEGPAPERQDLALDELCGRLASTYPSGAVEVQMPRLLVHLNLELLQRSLNNLVDNALEYGRPPVVLSAERQSQQLVIRVDDHGEGLASTDLMAVPALPRSDDRQRRQHLGLGLAIVERFCRDHGGRLKLESSPLGGLRAELQLPLACLKYSGPERRRRGDRYGGPERRGILGRFSSRLNKGLNESP